MKKILAKVRLTGTTAIVVTLMAVNFILHMLANAQYGLFFDEYYYYSMTYHLSFGYLDAPPVTACLMALSRLLLGDSVQAMHVFPALAGCFTMLFAAMTARRMGGGRFAQALAAAAVIFAPVFMTFSGMFTYDVFDQLMSAVVIFMVAGIVKGEATPRIWVAFGFIAGIGLMVKITMGIMLVCLIVGISLTRARKILASKWFWISAAIAAGCFLPFFLWQAFHGFPIYEYLQAYRANRTVRPSATALLQSVLIVMNPASVPLWLGGLALLFTQRGRAFRPFAWAFLAYFAFAAVLCVKFYALAGMLLPLVAFGSVSVEKCCLKAPPLLQKNKCKFAWALKAAYLAALCAVGAAFIPLNIPFLSPQVTAEIDQQLGYSKTVMWDNSVATGIPALFAGRLGWAEMAQALTNVYSSLPEEDRRDCTVCCSFYAVAGAMDYYDGKYGLPKAISPDLGCYYWGYDGFDGKCLIFVNTGSFYYWELQADFDSIQIVPGYSAVPYSTLSLCDRSIYICRGLKIPVEEFWQKMRGAT